MADKITLVSQGYVITSIKKPTKAAGFKDFKQGDVLRFSLKLSNRTGASGGGSYATMIRVINDTQDIEVVKSQSELANILYRSFELEEA